MGKIHINSGLFAANIRNFNPNSNINGVSFNSTTAILVQYLTSCGSNIKNFFNQPSDGIHTGEGQMAYLLDNYYEPAIKFNAVDNSLISLLSGSLAIVYVERKEGYAFFDIWNGEKLIFQTDDSLYELLHSKRVWVWAMGFVAKKKANSKHHSKSRHQTHHRPVHVF